MSGRLTIFNEPIAPWADAMVHSALLKKASAAVRPMAHVLTLSQVHQLGLSVRPEYLLDAILPEEALWSTIHAGFARAVLVHSERWRKINRRRGDVPVVVDITAPALSARGVALTSSEEALSTLDRIAKEHGYETPFWLTREEIMYFVFSHGRVQTFLNFDASRFPGPLRAGESIPSVELENDRGEICRVMNVSEFLKKVVPSASGVNRYGLFHCFRQFLPINVLTKRRFSHDVEDALRKCSISFGCWCSVWGTIHDYKKLGFEVLDGPLGVWVFDELDSPMYLTSAFSCTNPKAVFSHVYPNDLITFR
ncbi:hypothetical protein BCY84_15286 [Trypanosoma cruzi cruzi]|uniref:Trypanosoma Tc-38 (p38) protein domain-containing protein n=1 Tax=Trypanosoma cruzi TaxID=5693 RepID=A0A2V2VF34_TRYCR|nr:hypothetical protein TcBrA4_0130470 [Trypanosoma cruzi]PBJ72720.1 hypothetical protein BCY84_15286 [Trypanosoma cruzi cruzi]PWU95155.1 hypothetical protein C4B63_23g238 [Trypanosoma cruzi]